MTDLSQTVDLSQHVAPKSEQLNADDLIAGPMTVVIENVKANQSSQDQPISISFKGDGGKPYKPCLSMRRVLLFVWGTKGAAFVGRSMTLYRDPAVKFGGIEVAGIRISHMSDIEKPRTIALTASKTVRRAYTVQPLPPAADQQVANGSSNVTITLDAARQAARGGSNTFADWWKHASKTERGSATTIINELKALRDKADFPLAHDPANGKIADEPEYAAADAYDEGAAAQLLGKSISSYPPEWMQLGQTTLIDAFEQGHRDTAERPGAGKP